MIAIIVLVAVVLLGIWMTIRILHKAGYSGWWMLFLIIPVVNIIMIYIFAFSKWPKLENKSAHNQNK